jgi:hypothetical protein
MGTFLDRREAADYLSDRGLKTSWKTLQKKATTGGGPPYRIWGNRAVYEPRSLDRWADSKLSAPRNNTSEIENPATTDATT